MVLVDTSVWVDHLRAGSPTLTRLLSELRVFTHEYVIAELACGSLKNRARVLTYLGNLPRSKKASLEEVLFFIDRHSLNSRGIGYVDVSLLASAAISNLPILTTDKRLAAVAEELGRLYTALPDTLN